MKNQAIELLIALKKKIGHVTHHTRDPAAPRILILSTTGLGDTLWATPAIRAIKKAFPRAFLAILTSPIGKEILSGNPYLDEFYVTKNGGFFSLFPLYKKLKEKQFDKVLIFHTSQRPMLPLAFFTGACEIIGTHGINKGLDSILTTSLKMEKMHEITRRLKIAGVESDGCEMEIFLNENDRVKKSDQLLIGMQVKTKDRFKEWPASSFVALGKKLQTRFGAKILITGSVDERDYAAKIAQEIPEAISVAGKYPLKKMCGLIQTLDLLITNDTGPMHIACAFKRPLIALFGPTDPLLCGPYGVSSATIIAKDTTCTPCLRKKCRHPFCMQQISVEEVFTKAEELLYEKS